MFLLLNRFTVILMPVKHIKLWKYFLPISVLVIFLLPIPFTCIDLFRDYYVLRQPDNWTYTLYFHKAEYLSFINVPYIAAVAGIVFCVFCLVLNIATIVIYRLNQRRLMALGSGKEKENRVESRLTLYALITFAAQFLLSIYTMLIAITSGNFDLQLLFLSTFNQLPWVNDLTTIVVPSWVLLWACTDIRRIILKMFGFGSVINNESSVISIRTIQLAAWDSLRESD
ncbi:serpentine type 7TM GPCR chemoreceptor srv domain-containing protein [Ditylenchus destructor]|nr:serpentine type 7TM GPCR chemoreceptor srv domain-containing protein [Ditylenchus destructor]